jgi:hypothetical protein
MKTDKKAQVAASGAPATEVVAPAQEAPATEGVQNAQPQEAAKRPTMRYGDPQYVGWQRIGESFRGELEKTQESVAWQVAKWLVDGYKTFLGPDASNQDKGRLAQVAQKCTGFTTNTLKAYFKVGQAFPDGPQYGLTFAHHRAVLPIPEPKDRDYWLRQAGKHQMSVSNLAKAVQGQVPPKPKVGVNYVQEAKHYQARLEKLNPKRYIFDAMSVEINHGKSLEVYRELHNKMKQSSETLSSNLQHLEHALAGRPPAPVYIQDRIDSPESIEAAKAERIGAAMQAA